MKPEEKIRNGSQEIVAMVLDRLALAVAVGFVAAAAFFHTLHLERPRRSALLIGFSLVILASPLLIPPEVPLVRLIVSANAGMLVLKLYDLHVSADRGCRPDFRTYLLSLPNWFFMVLRKLEAEPDPPRRKTFGDLARGLVGLAICVAILRGLFRFDWYALPFAAEHSTKVLAAYLATANGMVAAVALWRLAGAKARHYFDCPYLARTPADFWRRYNRPVQQFLYEDVFWRAGGLHAPIRATLLTFATSAFLHEYVFGIAIGRFQGYQTAFFLLQGCAVVATMRMKPRGWAAVAGWALTFAFNLVSSLLFLASVNALVPFYSRALPAWLDGW